jgi:predicted DNA binding protein
MSQNKHQRESRPLTLVLEVPDRGSLIELLSAIEERGVSAVTREIRRPQESTGQQVHVDLGVLTEKQRRALELALEGGYYERPREIDLTSIAEQLDISKSAVSQRLRSAERKLIQNTLEPLL